MGHSEPGNWPEDLRLLPLCLVPFGAAPIARYPRDAVALRLYGPMLSLIAATRVAIWVYATGNSHLLYEAPARQFRRARVVVAVGPALAYLVAIVIAEVGPVGSMLIYGAVPCRLLRGRHRRSTYGPFWMGRERPDLSPRFSLGVGCRRSLGNWLANQPKVGFDHRTLGVIVQRRDTLEWGYAGQSRPQHL